jgi:hypothetical protein
MHPQQGIEPLEFAIHLYNDHSCSLNDAISPTREKEGADIIKPTFGL